MTLDELKSKRYPDSVVEKLEHYRHGHTRNLNDIVKYHGMFAIIRHFSGQHLDEDSAGYGNVYGILPTNGEMVVTMNYTLDDFNTLEIKKELFDL